MSEQGKDRKPGIRTIFLFLIVLLVCCAVAWGVSIISHRTDRDAVGFLLTATLVVGIFTVYAGIDLRRRNKAAREGDTVDRE